MHTCMWLYSCFAYIDIQPANKPTNEGYAVKCKFHFWSCFTGNYWEILWLQTAHSAALQAVKSVVFTASPAEKHNMLMIYMHWITHLFGKNPGVLQSLVAEIVSNPM